MAGATIGTYNLLFSNTPGEWEGDIRDLADRSSLLVLTEARAKAVGGIIRELGWQEFHRKDTSDRITWDPAIWAATDVFGSDHIHDKGPGKYQPARWLTWQALEHRASGTRHVFLAAHVTAGYAGDNPFQRWRDEAARRFLLAIVQHTARMCLRDDIEFHHLLGDLNAHRARTQEWWYPVRILNSLYMPDDKVPGLDYVMHTRLAADRGLEVARRWTVDKGMDSDHPAHLKRVRFPRHR